MHLAAYFGSEKPVLPTRTWGSRMVIQPVPTGVMGGSDC